MKVRRYKPYDFPDIAEWGEGWGARYSEDQFPETGFIVPGIAAYFLYKTDSSCCWLENMVANPDTDLRDRNRALGLLVDEILEEAQRLGFRVAYACTDIGKVVERAVLAGASFKPKYVLLTKKLQLTQ